MSKKYVGYTDKNNQMVYDGDLVQVGDSKEVYMVCLTYTKEVLLVNHIKTIEMYKADEIEKI